jgi:LuxR family maltose regulon positive regulatory protein
MKQSNRSGDRSVAGRAAGTEPMPLLLTKLYRPPVTPDLEPRTRLMERLGQNRHRPLTLISAPAGYGKTMLASIWLEACDCPGAWVSLDETDNDLQSFLSYLLAAVQLAVPTVELKTRALLATPALPAAPLLARYLLNDLDQISEPFILALDDVHLIEEQAVFDLLSELLHHPSPVLSLVLIGRRDPPLPIASLRAHRQVTEIRAGDLRFTPPETARLLGQVLRGEIDDTAAVEWTERTEGWVTGLLLAALSLRHSDKQADVRLELPEHSPYLQDYLLAEVLAHLPPERRDWLLLTSLLDRFCAPLCEVIGGPEAPDGPASLTGIEFIRWLRKENLFSIPLDDQGEWFRFHHLFQQLLQDRLPEHLAPGQLAAAHRRASHWFAGEGLIEEALQHALAAGEVQTAVHLVEQHRYELMNTQQWHRLDRWLNLLPADAVAQSPMLISTRAYLAVHRDQNLEMLRAMQQAEQLLTKLALEPDQAQVVKAEIAVIQGVLDVLAGRAAPGIAAAQRGLELLPPEALHIRSIAMGVIAVGHQAKGDVHQGVTVIREALLDPAWPPGLRSRKAHYLSIAYFQEGDLPSVLDSARECLRLAEENQLAESVSFGRYHLGVAHYLRNEFAQAEPLLLALLQDRAASAPDYLANGSFALALIYHAQGRTVEAAQAIELVSSHFQGTKNTAAQAMTECFRMELALREGKLSEACRLSKGVDFDLRPPVWFFYVPQLTPLKLLLAEGTAESLAEANTRLVVLGAEMRRIHRNNVLVDTLALQALVSDALGDGQTAMETLHAALELGIVGGNIRTFADLGLPMAKLLSRYRHEDKAGRSHFTAYVDRILAAFQSGTKGGQPAPPSATIGPPSSHVPTDSRDLIEPLTRRELEVLALLAQHLTYKEIGKQLFISSGTVGQHVVRIYQKLQVSNRHQALVKAQALGILPRY